jgi:pyridoxine kinase
MGDVGRGIFVRPGIPEFMRERAVPAADVITPNQFELDLLAGGESRSRAGLAAALDRAHALGPRVILVTSHVGEDTGDGMVDLVASSPAGRFRLRTPRLDVHVNGAGDAIAALFLVHLLRTRDAAEAMANAASSIHGVLRLTAERDSRELLTVAAQEEFVRPSRVFAAEAL